MIFKLKILMIVGLLVCITGSIAAQTYNYAEALQKAIYFYEAQQSGALPDWNRVEWRADSTTMDAVTGGWFDAGDHVKFGLPMAQSAGMLAWAAYEYKAGIEKAGQWTAFSQNLRFVLDYLSACHQGSYLVYQIGNGSEDHAYWGSAEFLEEKMIRPSYSTNASCVTGATAAALAIGSIVFGDAIYLSHAKALFTIADTVKSDEGYTAAAGFYQSWSGFYDELMWAAVWLYIATNDSSYLVKAESYVPNLNKQGYNVTDPIEYQWGHCWDDQHYGAMLLLARLTGKQVYIDFTEMHLDWWTSGYSGYKVTYTPGGLAWLDSWGALRYAANTSFLAIVYSDWVTDAAKKAKYRSFFENQINYALGKNPRSSSYVVGFGANPPKRPHHRNAHGSWEASITNPTVHRHILYGALVGGPDSSDGYTDDITNYTNNEVATDYNSGFTACLAKMVNLYGGTPLSVFPIPETKEIEYYVNACYNSGYGTYTEIRMQLVNKSGWPPALKDKLSVRYYVDLTEVFAKGIPLTQVYTSCNTTGVKISALQLYSGNIYYAVIDFTGMKIYPGGMQDYFKECQFQVGLNNATPDDWDTSNDFSYTGITSSFTMTRRIPVFDNGILLSGDLPSTPGPTSTVTSTATMTITPAGTLTRTPTTITRTATRTSTTITRTATATRTSTTSRTATRISTSTTLAPTRTITSSAGTPSRTITATPTVTGGGCTCDAGCSTITVITPNFTKDGSGQFCYEAASLGSYINSWNLTTLEVNGVDFTNKWTAASSLPAQIGGKYYVYYNSVVSYGHFEAMN